MPLERLGISRNWAKHNRGFRVRNGSFEDGLMM